MKFEKRKQYLFLIILSIVVFIKTKIKHTSQNVNFDVFDTCLILNCNVIIDEYFNSLHLSKKKFF